MFSALSLLLSRPFGVGDLIRLRSGALGGQLEGTVTEIGITYLRLETPDGVLHVPNAQVLAAATGPIGNSPGRARCASAGQHSRPPGDARGCRTAAWPRQCRSACRAAREAPVPVRLRRHGSAGPSTGGAGPPDGGQPPGVL